MKIAESPEKKRKLGPENGGDGKRGEKKKDEKGYPYPSKFAVIKKDLKSIIKDKRDSYNILFIKLSFFER
jgi:hypothetical protein